MKTSKLKSNFPPYKNISSTTVQTKATLLLQLNEFEKKYRQDVNNFKDWFNKTMEIRKSYKELVNKCYSNVEHYEKILKDVQKGNIPHVLKLERSFLLSKDEKELEPIYVEKKYLTKEMIQQEITLNKSEVKGGEYQYSLYTKLINNSMLENRVREKLAFLASYSIDYLERGPEAIAANNEKHFNYYSYLEIPCEGVLGDKNFAFEKVLFNQKEVKSFLKEYFNYIHNDSLQPSLLIKQSKVKKHRFVKETFEKLARRKANKDKTKKDILYLVASELKISYEAAKYNLYYKSKS